MAAKIDDNELNSLLSPVEMGSFMLSPGESTRSIYSGIPSTDKSKMWNFSITENGSGGRVLSFLVDNRALNFRLSEPETTGEPIAATRLPDTESDDFGVGGNSFTGRAQIHKSSPSKVVGTFQTGKNNMTFELSKSNNNGESWTVFPRKHPEANIKVFVDSILEKNNKRPSKAKKAFASYDRIIEEIQDANERSGVGIKSPSFLDKIKKTKINIPSIDTVTYPITGGMEAVPVAAGIGAAAMGLKNIGQKLFTGESQSLLKDILIGGAVGGGGSALFQFLGSPDSPIMKQRDKSLLRQNMDINKPMVFQSRLHSDPNYLDLIQSKKAALDKIAFGTGNPTVDLIALQSILGADPSLTQGDRNVLIQQARRALQSSGGSTSIPQIKNMGLGMLAGYILSKMMGFGGMATIATTAIGGGIGNSFNSRPGGRQYNSKGYYTY